MQNIADKKENSRAVVWEDVNYFEDARGMLARPKRRGNYPGVLMVHEYWGLNDSIKESAQSLASEGYVVFAIDLFHGQVTSDSQRAMRLVKRVEQDNAIKNMRAAAKYLRVAEKVKKIVSMGWCFGGGQSLQLAVSGEKLNGTIIYYGNLISDQQKISKIKWPILGIFGEKDEVVSLRSVKEFEANLNALRVENEIYVYPGVGHAFANPSNPKFAPEQAQDAWQRTLKFLKRNLKNTKKVKIKVIEQA